MPEWGMIPMPKALLKQGIRDMVRLSDARMSGTSFGACVLHVAPESYVGGPLALLRDGDIVRLDVPGRKLDMLVDEAELARRRAEWKQPPPKAGRGYNWMYARHIGQADTGCDFDFLQRSHGETVKEPDIF
jgi:dihydroxy-acid dehydratase